MSDNRTFAGNLICAHCQHKVTMEVVVVYAGNLEDYREERTTWTEGHVYELLKCPACKEITVRSYFWHDGYMEPGDVTYTVLYPKESRDLKGLPPNVEAPYKAALSVRNIEANAYGVLAGRVLDAICLDRKAIGDTLNERLTNLAERNEIPGKLVEIAAGLRKMRNIGAHGELGELTKEDLPVLDDLLRAVLEYVYSAPLLVQAVERRWAALRKKTVKRIKKGRP